MKIQDVHIKGYRSIENASLNNCGNLNVLIGRNNSGKSNVLAAIDGFFRVARNGEPVSIEPPFADTIDHFNHQQDVPITVTITFILATHARETLLTKISEETPSVRNAVEALPADLRLAVTVTSMRRPFPIAYVSEIALVPDESAGGPDFEAGRYPVMRMDAGVAAEIAEREREIRGIEQRASSIKEFSQRIDAEDWQRYRERAQAGLPFYFRPGRGEHEHEIRDILRQGESYEDFRSEIGNRLVDLVTEPQDIRARPLEGRLNTLAGDVDQVPEYVRSLLSSVGGIKVLPPTERRGPIEEKDAQRLLQLKTRRGGGEQLRVLQDTVRSILGVTIDAFTADSDESAELDIDNFLVEVNGSGIRQALRLILDIEFHSPDVILLEEPEMSLHPALEAAMMRYLHRITEEQVFVATHSTNFLDRSQAGNICLLRNPGATTKGPTDEDILRELASVLKVNLNERNIGFLPMGGSGNLRHFAVPEILDFLAKRRATLWLVLDRDELNEEDIEQIKDKLEGRATLHILRKREIENYLAESKALTEFMSKKGGKNDDGDTPTEKEVQEAIKSSIEDLRQLTVDKRVYASLCSPVYASRDVIFDQAKGGNAKEAMKQEFDRMAEVLGEAQSELDDEYNRIEKEVDEEWERRKQDIVPGDELIVAVCKKFGVAFRKRSGDARKLAALLTEDEIHQELKDLINQIGAEDVD